MKTAGIDIGSRAVKMVFMDSDEVLKENIVDTSLFYREFCRRNGEKLEVDFDSLGLSGMDKIVATGYGRNNVNVSGALVVVELKAHAAGAVWQTGKKDFVLLDIGGQDSKVMDIRNGKMVDLLLNDKCAASCGRYLENMAAVLGVGIEELEKHYSNPVTLNSTCSVFGESELIGRISEGCSLESMAAGVNYSLFKRIKPMLERFSKDAVVVTGGVARNKAIIHYIKEEMNFKEVIVPAKPQLNGALGCCTLGRD